ncbi:MAG: sulfite exporter TauE/SafE family protein [Clostridia bacterium]|nr:sulfite exporter TauE/SafE family protein [Clostridia bacterium]
MPVWLSAAAALVISALSGMGVGGGGLFVIYLALATDTPQLAAQGMNLLFFLFSAGSALLVHLQKRKILWWAVGVMVAAAIPGALLGTFLASYVSQSLLRKIFGAMLVTGGILALQNREA